MKKTTIKRGVTPRNRSKSVTELADLIEEEAETEPAESEDSPTTARLKAQEQPTTVVKYTETSTRRTVTPEESYISECKTSQYVGHCSLCGKWYNSPPSFVQSGATGLIP